MIHKNTYNKVDFNGAKGLVFIGDKILTYRRDNKTSKFPLRIDLPGGGRENDESPFDTFKREVKEEFGVSIRKDDIKFSCTFQSFDDPSKISYFMVTKPLKLGETDIIFGNEGIEWLLMAPNEYIIRHDCIERQQIRVRKYLNEELVSE